MHVPKSPSLASLMTSLPVDYDIDTDIDHDQGSRSLRYNEVLLDQF